MKVFVTGATGLLGGSVVRQLLAQGHEVLGLVRDPRKARPQQGLTWCEGDIEFPAGWRERLHGCQAVVHCAAYFREYYGRGDHWPRLVRLNVQATLELLEESLKAGVSHFVHITSSGTLHPRSQATLDEECRGQADLKSNLYFRSKILTDEAIDAWPGRDRLRVITILPGWMFGPEDVAPTAAGRLVHDFLNGKLPAVPPGGTGVVDARDVASAIVAALERQDIRGRYVVAGPTTTLANLTRLLEKVSGQRGPRLHLPYRLAMLLALVVETVARWLGKDALITREGIRSLQHGHQYNSSRAQRDLGVTFRPLEETLSDCVTWWRSRTTTDSA